MPLADLAVGRAAVAHFVRRGGVVLAVAVVAAVPIFVSEPGAALAGSFAEEAELLGHGAGFGGAGGGADHAVALSADGNTALVGAPNGNPQSDPSYTLIFTRSGLTWSDPTSLVGELEGGEHEVPVGDGVALSADGSTALVGSPPRVFAFTREGATWRSTRIESPPGTACGGGFGHAVAISEDGNTAAIGDPSGCPEDFDGSAWIYSRSGNAWTLQAGPLHGEEKINPIGNEAQFASTVAISGDGNKAIVGAESEGDGLGCAAGAAWVYTRSGSTWSQDGPKLSPPGGPCPHFGRSVALSGDGSRALIGTYGEDKEEGSGAWVFDRGPAGWTPLTRLSSGEHSSVNGSFGWSVALSPSGNTALIGGPETGPQGDAAFRETGEAWAFRCAASGWIEEPIAAPVSTEGGNFGYSVALADNGAAALVSEPGVESLKGAAFVFSGPPDQPGFCTSNVPPAGSVPPPGGQGSVAAAPVVESLRQTHQAWREGRALASLARRHVRTPVGTTFAFTLNVPASVTFTFTEAAGGRMAGAKCVAQTLKNKHKRRCTRTVTAGAMTFGAHSGTSKLRFQGLVSRHRRLKPGSYTLLVTAAASGKRSATRTLHFTIAKG